ncbi:MAG TPA: hypothetical protein VEG39_16955 [Clostridia bacterium]|nr:hypothetical protein [Clostridia bacterium]
MNRFVSRRFLNIYIVAFMLLFVIMIVMPELVDRIMHLFSEMIIPKNNSIIVFKEFVERQEAVMKFLKIIKKAFIEAL